MKDNSRKILIVLAVIVLLVIAIFGTRCVLTSAEYAVAFDTDGGSVIEGQTVQEGAFVIRPVDPQKDGFEFSHWELNNEEYDFSTEVTEEITLKAVYTEAGLVTDEITLLFDDSFGTINAVSIIEGKLLLPADPVREGYEFVRWECDGVEFNFDGPLVDGMKIYAVWEEIPEEYSISFYTGGGSSVSRQIVIAGDTIQEPDPPTRSGYIFLGWFLDGEEYDFSQPVTEEFTLRAEWEEEPQAVDKSALVSAISSASSNLRSTFTSRDGSDVNSNNMWVTSAVKTTYENAIATAQAVVDDADATQESVDAALRDLNQASTAFNNAKKAGTRVVPTTTTTTPTTTTKADVFTFTSQRVDDFTPQYFITILKNGSPIGASEVLQGNVIIGDKYNDGGRITVDGSELGNINRAKLDDGTYVSISK